MISISNNRFFMSQNQSLSQKGKRKQAYKQKTIKLLRHKLRPLAEEKILSLGHHDNSEFKNLQKIPKLKKKPYNRFEQKTFLEEILESSNVIDEQKENRNNLTTKIYEEPKKFLRIWNKTTRELQSQYLKNKQKSKINSSIQTILGSQYSSLIHNQSQSINIDTVKTNQNVLSKVNNFKKYKNQELQQKKKERNISSKNPIKKSTIFFNKVFSSFTQHKNQQKIVEKDKKQDEKWVSFITDVIFKKNINTVEEQKIFAEYKARRKQNKIKTFIDMFQSSAKISKTCHLQNLTEPKKEQKNDSVKDNPHEVKQRVIEMNNPIFKLRRLQSLCKIAQKQKQGSKDRSQKSIGFQSDKIRINSNHKKIIKTQR